MRKFYTWTCKDVNDEVWAIQQEWKKKILKQKNDGQCKEVQDLHKKKSVRGV